MTSARIVTPGQAMARIPATTAKMPSRINEVDDDLNMTGSPFACLSRTTVESVVRVTFSRHDARRFRPTSAAYRGIAAGYAKLIKTDPGSLAIGEALAAKRPPTVADRGDTADGYDGGLRCAGASTLRADARNFSAGRLIFFPLSLLRPIQRFH